MNPEEYAATISTPVPSYLVNLERETHLKMSKPQMLTGYLQGRFLSMISRLLQPTHILEIGTYSGYGSLCLAEGMKKEGRLVTIDINPENCWLAKKYFALSPFAHQMEILIGPALEEIPKLTQTWDLVFIDADKQQNEAYVDLVWPNLRPGGVLLIDNIFARGGVWKPTENQLPFEKATSELNQKLASLTGATVLALPFRDGITCVLKNHLP